MKELYIAPEAKQISFVADKKLAAQGTLNWGDFEISLSGSTTNVSKTDIKIPITKLA